MIITCPQCSTKYNLTAQQIGEKGRKMRCAKCAHSWFQAPVKEETTPPIAPENKENSKNNTRKKIKVPLIIAIGILLLTIAGIVFWLFSGGDTPVPNSYNPVTLNNNSSKLTTKNGDATGLVLSEIKRDVVKDGNLNILLFTGKVTNTSNNTVVIPEIRVQLLDSKGIELDFWPAELPVKELKKAESTNWKVRFLNPPLEKIAKFKVFFR